MGKIERGWVSWIDSDAWRRVARSGAGTRVLRSRPFRAMDTGRRYLTTSWSCIAHPGRFEEVSTFCVFIGHVKSGGTLLGSLIDAHPNALLADEIDALRYVAAGFRRDQVFHLLTKGSRREAMKGRVTARRLDSYAFAVPGQWQGRSTQLRVIGESRAGPTTRHLGDEPDLLPRLHRVMGRVRPRFIHVVRDPYDPIAAMARRSKRSLPEVTADYAARCRTLTRLRETIDPAALLTVRYEDVVRDPVGGLAETCRFLGLEPETGYLEACASVIEPTPRRDRDAVRWDARSIDAVASVIAGTPFLRGYGSDA